MKIRRRRETEHEQWEREHPGQSNARARRIFAANARRVARQQRKADRKARRAPKFRPAGRNPGAESPPARGDFPQSDSAVPGSLRIPRIVALAAISVVIGAADLTSFAESYRGLFDWAREHGLSGVWAAAWPLQVDTFIVVGELALFTALVDRWTRSQRAGAWVTTLAGLCVSVAGNVGHVHSHLLSNRATAAVPPLAAFAALWVGLGVLKRVVGQHHQAPAQTPIGEIPSDVLAAAKASMRATIAAGNPWSVNGLQTQFSLTRAQATEVRQAVLSETNGHQAT